MNVEENEIQDLKDDLADALKENARLQSELEEVYGGNPTEQELDKGEFDRLKQEFSSSQALISQLSSQLEAERHHYASGGADLMRALSIIKNFHLNGKPSWEFFQTRPGQDELSWASKLLESQMSKFFKDYGG